MTPSPPNYSEIRLHDIKPTWVGDHPFKPGFVIGADNGVVAFTDENGIETSKRCTISVSQEAINGVAGFGDYLAVSTPGKVAIFALPSTGGRPIGSGIIQQGAHGVLATGRGHFLAPIGHDGVLVVTPSVELISQSRISTFPGTPLNFYQLCGLPPFNGGLYFVAACRSRGVGLIDMSITTGETGLRVRAFEADVVDVAYLGNEDYPYAIAAVGMRGELLLCRDIVRQEPPITLHYQNLAGRVYRICMGHGHLWILTSKAIYVLGDLARRLVQPRFVSHKSPIMTMPIEAIDMAVVGDKWLLAVMPDSVRRYDIKLIHERISEFARNDVNEEPFEPTPQPWTPREVSLV